MQSNQKDYEVQINLKGFFRVIIHRKWIFIITAIIIFAICMVYTFIFSPEYSSSSQIKISDDDIYYNNDIYRYFPDEASSLWILKDYHRVDTAVEKLYSINSELKSDSLLNEIITKTAINISPSMLYRSIDIYIDRGIGTLTITTYLKSGESAYKVNKALLETYINLKKTALENAYNDLLNKVESRLVEINSDMESLSLQAQQSAIEFGIKWQDELKESDMETIEIRFVDPVLERKTETLFEEFSILNNIKQNMINNRDFFIDRIQVIHSPEMSAIQNNTNFLRNILLSLIASIVIALILTFIVNYFKSLRNL